MKINRSASAAWSGGLRDGKGSISTESGALSAYPYGFAARFEGKKGTNPEELLGAAHAGCFTMALSGALTKRRITAEHLSTTATVTLEPVNGAQTITRVHLKLNGRVPGISAADFEQLAQETKDNCIVSRVLKAELSVDATLA